MNHRQRMRGGTCRPDRRAVLGGLLAAGAAVAGAGPSHAAPAAATPAMPAGLPALRRGLNLTHWFEYEQGQDVPAAELAALRAAGFDHVRIPVDPVVGGWVPDGGVTAGVRPAFMAALRAALEAAIGAGLEVVFDLHTTPESKARIEQQAPLERSLVALWSQFGRALADLPTARLAFELYNEPQYYGAHASRWPPLQQRLLAALRERAPRHLVLLSGNEGGSLKGLRATPPLAGPADTAVAWTFHYYEPFLFTHQGAHWLDTRYTTAGLRGDIRYPAALQAGITPKMSRPHPRAAQELADYRAAGWGAARVRADIDAAGAWARQLGLRLVCNEFGAIRAHVDAASRYRWMADVRSALEANALGWTLWDYTDIFGITSASAQLQRSGTRAIEPAALHALGLQTSSAAR